jgi:hypothetical protein
MVAYVAMLYCTTQERHIYRLCQDPRGGSGDLKVDMNTEGHTAHSAWMYQYGNTTPPDLTQQSQLDEERHEST